MTQDLSVFEDELAISGGKFIILDMKNTNKAGKVIREHDLTLAKEQSRLNVSFLSPRRQSMYVLTVC